MRQEQFERAHETAWQALERLLAARRGEAVTGDTEDADPHRLPELYRGLCNDYALALSRGYSPLLVERLHGLALRAHQVLYRRDGAWLWRSLQFVAAVFPRTLRRHARLLWLACALFLLPGVLLGTWCANDPEAIFSVLGDAQVAEIEAMYDPLNRVPGREPERSADSDFAMFGFYIFNNIGIGFRTFAGGILLGIGTVFTLLYNGVVIGGIAGHLTGTGFGETFWPFVSGHGAFELTGIVVCGCAGLLLARAVLAPGRMPRARALREAALEAVKLVSGAALLLVLAAFVEAFWSSSASVSATVKYAVAAAAWLAVLLYLAFAGREHGPR